MTGAPAYLDLLRDEHRARAEMLHEMIGALLDTWRKRDIKRKCKGKPKKGGKR